MCRFIFSLVGVSLVCLLHRTEGFILFWIACTIVLVLSYIFWTSALIQIIGSIYMIIEGIKKPYTFTLILWTFICIGMALLIYFFLPKYFLVYLISLILTFIFHCKYR